MALPQPIGKTPPPLPFDLEAEQALLGALLVNNAGYALVSGFLKPSHFYEALHARIYDVIGDMIGIGRLASPTTLRLYFSRDIGMREIGGPKYLAELCAHTPSVINTADFAKMIVEYACRRAIIRAGDEIRAMAEDPPVSHSASDVLASAEGLIGEVSRSFDTTESKTFRPIGIVGEEAIGEALSDRGPAAVYFGIERLDEHTGGMRAGEFVILGGRPGMGKSAFAAHVALTQAEAGLGVAFFSLEMTSAAIALRLACAIAYHKHHMQIHHEKVRRGGRFLADAERDALFGAEGHLRTLPVWTHEGRKMSVGQLSVQARQLKRAKEHTSTPLRLVVIDQLQKITPDRQMQNKVTEMTEITGGLAKLAGELQVPILALSALNRKAENREDRRPELGDLRESGSIESDADTVLLLYREAYYVQKKEPGLASPDHTAWYNELSNCRNDLDIMVAKQRHGSEGLIRAFFDGPSSAIKDR